MIVVITRTSGVGGDSVMSNQHAYDLPVNKVEDVTTLHKAHLYRLMKEKNIMVNPTWPDQILINRDVRTKTMHAQILREHNIYNWIEKNWNVNPLEFGTIHE